MAVIQFFSTFPVLLLSLACDRLSGESADYHLLVALPEVDGRVAQQSWQNNQQISNVVERAKQSVQQLDLPFTLSVADDIIRTDCSSSTAVSNFLEEYVREVLTAFDSGKILAGVIGIFCRRISDELKGISDTQRLGLAQIALNTFQPDNMNKEQNYYQVFPSSLAYADALAQFMQHVGWTRIAVVHTQSLDGYYYEISKQVIGILMKKGLGGNTQCCQVDQPSIVAVEVTGDTAGHIMTAIRSIHASGVKIVYVLLPPEETVLLLCHAYDYGLHWPEYGWVVPDVSLEDALQLSNVEGCGKTAMQGIVSFRTTNSEDNITWYENSSKTNCDSLQFRSNLYARALYDSILSTALSLNATLARYTKLEAQRNLSQLIVQEFASVSFVGNETQITVYQILDKAQHKLATYNPHVNTIRFTNNFMSAFPSGNLTREYTLLPSGVVTMFTVVLALSAIVTTLNMILFLYYRKEPEIKASSAGISMLIHISCYFLLIGCQYDIWGNGIILSKQNPICLTLVWTIYPWGDVILATLLVKICRIYHIFNHFGKIKNVCTDKKLLVPLLLIVLMKVTILLVWSAHDTFIITDVEIFHSETKPPYCEVVQHCYSDHFQLWLSASLCFTGILGGVTGFVAFKTRKIRRKNFKDTKKVNLTIVTCFIGVAILVPIWWISRSSGNTNLSRVAISTLYLIIAICCQVCLFCPKTLPPLKRSLHRFMAKQPRRKKSCTHEKRQYSRHPKLSRHSLDLTLTTRTTLMSLDV